MQTFKSLLDIYLVVKTDVVMAGQRRVGAELGAE